MEEGERMGGGRNGRQYPDITQVFGMFGNMTTMSDYEQLKKLVQSYHHSLEKNVLTVAEELFKYRELHTTILK